MNEKPKKRYDISIKQSPKDKYVSGIADSFRDTWGPNRSVNVGGHAGVREVEKMFEKVDGVDE